MRNLIIDVALAAMMAGLFVVAMVMVLPFGRQHGPDWSDETHFSGSEPEPPEGALLNPYCAPYWKVEARGFSVDVQTGMNSAKSREQVGVLQLLRSQPGFIPFYVVGAGDN